MRQNNNPRRGRGRSGRRPNVPHRAQTFDSNGPEGRIRGNATQVNEKYLGLARDAQSAGDRVLAEAYLQHAEHYYRVLNDSTDPQPLRPQQPRVAPDGEEAPGEARGDGGEPAAVEPRGEAEFTEESTTQEASPEGERPRRASREGGRRRRGPAGGESADGAAARGEAEAAPGGSEEVDAGLRKMLGDRPRRSNGPAVEGTEDAGGAGSGEDEPAPRPRRRRRTESDDSGGSSDGETEPVSA